MSVNINEKMNEKEFYEDNGQSLGGGVLYVVATPIGNLGDISARAIEVLSMVDVIAAEDTRTTSALISKLGIGEHVSANMVSYHEHNKAMRRETILGYLDQGKNVALVSDAGTPGISDPGEDIVRCAIEAGYKVTAIPGAVAFITALVMSGMSTRRFVFEGFLPNDKKEHKQVLESLKYESRTMILYEAPHRLVKTLSELREYVGGDREVVLARELTKRYEEVLCKSIDEWLEYLENVGPRGEYVMIVEGCEDGEQLRKSATSFWSDMSIEEHFEHYVAEGMKRNDAVKAVAADRGVSKRDIYDLVMK